MSRSRREPYSTLVCVGAGSQKKWRTSVSRVLRRKSKQVINSCDDYDNLILPTIKEVGNIRDSPNDGRKRIVEVPLLNQCEVRFSELCHKGYTFQYKIFKDGHFNDGEAHWNCTCYTNKRSYYWKETRK